MKSDIQRQIKLTADLITEKRYSDIDLITLSQNCLSINQDPAIFHKILDYGHLKNITSHISKNKLTDIWFELLLKMIIKSNFHTGYMLQQRANRYKEKIAFNVIKKGNIKTLSYNALWLLVKEIGRSISTFEIKLQKPVIGILTHNQLNSVLVDLACLSFGYRIVPLPLNATPEHIDYIIMHAEITHLFIGGEIGIKLWNETQSKN